MDYFFINTFQKSFLYIYYGLTLQYMQKFKFSSKLDKKRVLYKALNI